MKTLKSLALALGFAALLTGVSQAAVDTRELTNPGPGSTQWDQYLYYSGDWGWTHGAIAGTYSNYSLSISAWDVDNNGGIEDEYDAIWAKKDGIDTFLGNLSGADGIWSFSHFYLDSTWAASINAGLQVRIDIDSGHNQNWWAVQLTKSVLSTSGLPTNPNPGGSPGVPDESSALMLFGAASLALAAFKRAKK